MFGIFTYLEMKAWNSDNSLSLAQIEDKSKIISKAQNERGGAILASC
jgi:hypothetical protein